MTIWMNVVLHGEFILGGWGSGLCIKIWMKGPKILLYIITGNRGISDWLRAHKLSSYALDVLTLGLNDHEHPFLNFLIGWEISIQSNFVLHSH